jgi:hypothetical protein
MAKSRALNRHGDNGFGLHSLAGILLAAGLAHMWTDAPIMARAIGATTAYGLAAVMTSLAVAVAALTYGSDHTQA